jgi:hypothetical protein
MLCTDWRAYLTKLIRSFDSCAGPQGTVGGSSFDPPIGMPVGASHETDLVTVLFRSLCQRMKNMSKNHVMINFEIAAMYLAMVLKVNVFVVKYPYKLDNN